MKYRCIIFDADDTLVDYREDAVRAFRAALRTVGAEREKTLAVCLEFDYGNWERVGLSDVHLSHIQERYHELYRAHVDAIFSHADEVCGLGGRAKEAADAFLDAFSRPGTPVEGAEETVRALAPKYRVFAATNGLASLQHSRLSRFPLEGVFVSEELGAIKPSAEFFSRMLARIGESPASCLMVGDSLASDIRGAHAAGMGCVFFDRAGTPLPAGENFPVISDLRDLLRML